MEDTGCHEDLFLPTHKKAVLDGSIRELHKHCSVCDTVFVLYLDNGILKTKVRQDSDK